MEVQDQFIQLVLDLPGKAGPVWTVSREELRIHPELCPQMLQLPASRQAGPLRQTVLGHQDMDGWTWDQEVSPDDLQ